MPSYFCLELNEIAYDLVLMKQHKFCKVSFVSLNYYTIVIQFMQYCCILSNLTKMNLQRLYFAISVAIVVVAVVFATSILVECNQMNHVILEYLARQTFFFC